MKHLQWLWNASRERLPLRTPGTVVFPVPNISQLWIIHVEEYLLLLNDSGGEFKLLLEKVHSFNDIFM